MHMDLIFILINVSLYHPISQQMQNQSLLVLHNFTRVVMLSLLFITIKFKNGIFFKVMVLPFVMVISALPMLLLIQLVLISFVKGVETRQSYFIPQKILFEGRPTNLGMNTFYLNKEKHMWVSKTKRMLTWFVFISPELQMQQYLNLRKIKILKQ